MVVFEHLVADNSGELWNTDGVPDYSASIELVTEPEGPNAFKMLPASRYKLGGVNKKKSGRLLDGRADALLIAEWCRRHISGQIE